MLGKLAVLAHSKAGLAVLGVLAVGGSGTAVATVAAQHNAGPLAALHQALESTATTTSDAHGDANGDGSSHAHTVSFEGILAACGGAPVNTITITLNAKGQSADQKASQGSAQSSDHASTQSQGKDNSSGQTKSQDASSNNSQSATKASPDGTTTHVTESGTQTITVVDGKTSVTGENATSLADLCQATNINHKVEVSTTKTTTNGQDVYTAWKVTLQGADPSAKGAEHADQQATPEATEATTPSDGANTGSSNTDASVTVHTVTGNVVSVADNGSFVLSTQDHQQIAVTAPAKSAMGVLTVQVTVGETVTVRGTANADGSMVALEISVVARNS